MNTYGTLTSQISSIDEVISATTSNGTSSFVVSGQVVQVIVCDWSARASYTPTLYSAYPADSSYIATDIRRKIKPGGLCEITITYTAPATDIPATAYIEQSSQMEVDIREHPNFSDWADQWDQENERFLPSSSKSGIKSYIKGTTTVTVRSFYASKPSSDRANIGTIQNPGSDYSGTNNWLLVGSNRSQQGPLWIKENIYLYSAKAWDEDIYGA